MAAYHPQIVHFVIALLALGVILRVISLAGRPAFVGPAAATLLLLGTAASVVAVQSGVDAHGPVERVPGARSAVVDHEEWGIRTRNLFLIVAAVELLLITVRRLRRQMWVYGMSAALGVAGLWCVYHAARDGGALVYSYAGGIGIRSGDPKDVERLLLAGLYHQAQQDRRAGKPEEAALLVEQAARRFPGDVEVQLLAAESLLIDRRDAPAALAALDRMVIAADNRVLVQRRGNLRVDALEAAGRRDEALAELQSLVSAFPTNARLRQRLEKLKGN